MELIIHLLINLSSSDQPYLRARDTFYSGSNAHLGGITGQSRMQAPENSFLTEVDYIIRSHDNLGGVHVL
jgi:hypothetical protein